MSERENGAAEIILPDSEADSLIIHGQGTCPYARCSYCPLFSGGKSESFDHDLFEQQIQEEARRFSPEEITSVFLAEGNTISMEMGSLRAILATLYKHFPFLARVSAYGSALAVSERLPGELDELRRLGLSRIHMGMESGNEKVLEILNKGVDVAIMEEAANEIKRVGLQLTAYALIGAGGAALSEAHVTQTAAMINRVRPDTLALQTLVAIPQTPLYEQIQSGEFEQLSPHGTIMEIKALLSAIEVELDINCSHISNHCHGMGRLPEDRGRLLNELDYTLSIKESQFNPSTLINVSLPE